MLTAFHTYAYKKLFKVITIRILAFHSGRILALLKAVCSPLNKIFAVNIRNLLLGMRLQCTWSKEIASLQVDKEMCTYYARMILDAKKPYYSQNYASIIYQGLTES